jgi:two-component sensor histidine kinase/PAS domain-containing protein
MSRHPQPPRPAPRDYTLDIDRLDHQLAAFTLRRQEAGPTPPCLAEAVEELATTVEELHAINADLAASQQAAIEGQRRYQELFDGVPEAYLVTDAHGLIQEANRPAAHLLHIDRAQLAGLPLGVFIAPHMRRSFQAQLAWLRHGAEVREWVVGVQPRHRPEVTVVCQVAPALDADGQLIGLRWLLRDLKAQRQVQETLEQRVRDLTTELAQAQGALVAMRERAALRERELHHRVNNHLQIAASLLGGQGHGLQDPHARTVLQACQGHLRTIALLHELLSRAGEGERLALGSYLRRLALLLFKLYGIDRERVRLTLEAGTVVVAVPTALACGLLVHEVLANVLRHAFQGDQVGAVAIALREEPAGRVTLTIGDTGVGVPMDLEAHEADGLGLRLVRALTEQLHGTLVVARDQGTCVTLRFPI